MKKCPKCGLDHADYLLVCSVCDVRLQRIGEKYSEPQDRKESNKYEEAPIQNEQDEFIKNIGNAPFEDIFLALESEFEDLHEVIKQYFTVEKIILNTEFCAEDKSYLLEKLHDYDNEDAKELIRSSEKEIRDARLWDIKRKISQKTREMYGDVPSDSKRTPIPDDVKDAVWRRDGGKCVRCGSQERLEFDHMIPVSKGGSDTARNIQLLCEKCNREKSDNIG